MAQLAFDQTTTHLDSHDVDGDCEESGITTPRLLRLSDNSKEMYCQTI